MDEALDNLLQRLRVAEGRCGTWVTGAEGAALLALLEREAVSVATEHRMIEGPRARNRRGDQAGEYTQQGKPQNVRR